MSTQEDRIDQEQAQEAVADSGQMRPLTAEERQEIMDDIERRRANAAAGRDENQDAPTAQEGDTEALATVPARTTAEALDPILARMPVQPKPLVERITDAATAFADAVRNMTMAGDSRREKITARDKAQTAVDDADTLSHTTQVSGIAAADALVAVVNEWKVDVASRA